MSSDVIFICLLLWNVFNLQGTPGRPGEQGAQGSQGKKGDNGAQGARGLPGIAGTPVSTLMLLVDLFGDTYLTRDFINREGLERGVNLVFKEQLDHR